MSSKKPNTDHGEWERHVRTLSQQHFLNERTKQDETGIRGTMISKSTIWTRWSLTPMANI